MARALIAWCACAVVALFVPSVFGQGRTVQDLTRIRGQGEYVLTGIGLVAGLAQTGDGGKEMPLARPLARFLENSGNAVGLMKELERGKSVALVSVSCVLRDGARADDQVDVVVTTLHSATSLRGGRLLIAPLKGPFPDSPVFALAEGPVYLEDPTAPTSGRVTNGARLIADLPTPDIEDTFELILDPQYAGWSSAARIAEAVNAEASPLGAKAATVLSDRSVRVTVPAAERRDRAAFLADVLSARVDVGAMRLPAQVICNAKTGAIVVTGDVTITPGIITHKDLTITTVTPAAEPTLDDPRIDRSRWTGVATQAKPGEAARLNDLLAAFKRLDVPPAEQIQILRMLHRTGRLQAKLIVE